MSCRCKVCEEACKTTRVGWPTPNQVEKYIEHFLCKDVDELIETGKFAIDWDEDNNLILAPNIKQNEGNFQYGNDPRGECVFYDNGCTIHDIKPRECSDFYHYTTHREAQMVHDGVRDLWRQSTLLDGWKDRVVCTCDPL